MDIAHARAEARSGVRRLWARRRETVRRSPPDSTARSRRTAPGPRVAVPPKVPQHLAAEARRPFHRPMALLAPSGPTAHPYWHKLTIFLIPYCRPGFISFTY